MIVIGKRFFEYEKRDTHEKVRGVNVWLGQSMPDGEGVMIQENYGADSRRAYNLCKAYFPESSPEYAKAKTLKIGAECVVFFNQWQSITAITPVDGMK